MKRDCGALQISCGFFLFITPVVVQEPMVKLVLLQRLTTLVSHQRVTFLGHIDTYRRLTDMTEPRQQDELQNIDRAEAATASGVILAHTHDLQRMDGNSHWVISAAEALLEIELKQLLAAIVKSFIETAHVITQFLQN